MLNICWPVLLDYFLYQEKKCRILKYISSNTQHLLLSFNPPGSPGSPQEILVTKSASGLTVQWTEGDSGEKPTTGYIIEARPSGKPWESWRARCPQFPYSAHAETHPAVEMLFLFPVSYRNFVIYYMGYHIFSCLGIVTGNYPNCSSFQCGTSLVNHPADEPIQLIIKTHLNVYSIFHTQGLKCLQTAFRGPKIYRSAAEHSS